MKISMVEIIRTERFVANELHGGERLLFEAKLVVDKDVQYNVVLHKLVHRLVRLYHRRKIKRDIEHMHNKLFQDPAKAGFQESVLKHFNS